ncbi:hypothetical protein HQQ80_19090 [Microbacteriaceae bacterium VKM Ac-2855]|nr:hypothetical protein [Microbacteriaceae bacterium VKM Ac-2855]
MARAPDLFVQAEEMIDVAAGVYPADWKQIVGAQALPQLKLRNFARSESAGEFASVGHSTEQGGKISEDAS